MKRSIIGLVLLLLLLTGCLLASGRMIGLHQPLARQLAQAAEWSVQGNWSAAEAQVAQIRGQWERAHGFCAAFTDHTPMEEVACNFAQLAVYRQLEDPIGYAATCAELACQLEAIAEAQRLDLKNLF